MFDVWCAYLRMPYSPPTDVLKRAVEFLLANPRPDAEPLDQAIEEERRQELEVRLTAQRLLGTHLSIAPTEAGKSTYWLTSEGRRLIIDLVGAVLVDFNAGDCAVGRANFRLAQLHGYTYLDGVQFRDSVSLEMAQFHGDASLNDAQFYGDASLSEAQFHGDASLSEAQFHGVANLDLAQFHGDANLAGVKFHDLASLSEAQFHCTARLVRAEFRDSANLTETQFHGDADFTRAQFHGVANLDEAQFAEGVNLKDSWATSRARLPVGWLLQAAQSENDQLRPVVREDHVSNELHD